MLIMPILNKGRDGKNRIYNVEIKLKNACKVKQNVNIRNHQQKDIIINGISFNQSIYNTKNKEPNAVINFLRNYNYRTDNERFLITTKNDVNSNTYDLYNVVFPPRKITSGLDNLYGSALLDLKNEIPNIKRGKYISLKKMGVDRHITDEKLKKLEDIVLNEKDLNKRNDIMQLRGIGDLQKTIEYMDNFDFIIVNEATILEDELNNMLNIFSNINTRDTKGLLKYYEIAKENQEVYSKLTQISKILYNKPINLIKKNNKEKIKIKVKEDGKNAA